MPKVTEGDPTRFFPAAAPTVAFLRYPASVIPDEGTNAVVTGDYWQSAGPSEGGVWCTFNGRPMAREVRWWTVMEQDSG